MISLHELNAPQREAAMTIQGPVLILAGAGSGKTRTITFRVAHMVENLRLPPQSILGISFTNKAAQEMRERVESLLGKKATRGLTLSTFHALGVSILKEEIHHLGYHPRFTIYDASDQLALVREALRHFRANKNFDQKVVMSKISYLKNRSIGPEEFPNSPYYNPEAPYDDAVYHAYTYVQEKLKFFNAIDFDDILSLCVRLFERFPEIAQKWSQKYKYIMIDEYQDTNSLQFRLVRSLTSTHQNLCVVGDDDQSIYGFRGADIENILAFEKNFPNAKVIKLEENYRSTMPILRLSNAVIKENKNRKDKTLWSQKESSDLPLLWATADTDHEAAIVVDDILKYQKEGGKLSDIAILFRSNTQIQPFEDQLRLSQVPYQIVGGQKFYDKKEVKDLLAYMAVINNPRDSLSLRRILNVPQRGIGQATLTKYLEKAEETKFALFKTMDQFPQLDPKKEETITLMVNLIRKFRERFQTTPLSKALEELITELHYNDYIDKSYPGPNQAARRKADVQGLIETTKRFEKYHQSEASLGKFLERILLQDNQDNQKELLEAQGVANEVTLITLHSAKGLEYDRVYMVGMEEDLLPHKKSTQQGEDISEERRLCYVGITRARKKLIMTHCKQRKLYGKDVPREVSRFVYHLGDDFILRQDRTTFGHMTQEEAQVYKKNFFEDLIASLD